jgi:hypothetical protein
VKIAEDRKAARLTRWITSFRRVGKLYRRSSEVHHLRLYRASELAQLLRRAGFKVRILLGYGADQFAGRQVALVARKQ